MGNKKEDGKYAYLNQLNTEQLEDLLRADFESTENENDGVIFHILEVIERRESIHQQPDVDKAWEEFQQHYSSPEEGSSLYPCHTQERGVGLSQKRSTFHRRFKGSLVIAAIVASLLGSMLVAQASGMDVFGALGRWTEETFGFAPAQETNEGAGLIASPAEVHPYHDQIQEVVDDSGIEGNLVPTWYPDGFELVFLEGVDTGFSNNVTCAFEGRENQFFRLDISCYQSISDLTAVAFEKDGSAVETYTTQGKIFYIMSNLEHLVATWSDGEYLLLGISGTLSNDDLKKMINSIGV